MKRLLMITAVLGIAAVLATPLIAQTVGAPCPWMGAGPGMGAGGGPGGGMMMGGMGGPHGRHAAHMAQMCADAEAIIASRLAYVETKLALTAAQKPAFDQFATRIRGLAPTLKGACPEQDDDDQPATLPERLAFMTKHADTHATVIKTIKSAVDELYPALTEAQRKTADGLSPFGMGMGMGMGGRGGPPVDRK